MEATAAFVFSSGGVVRVDELSSFFQRRPEVFAAVLTAAELTRSLKKIVDKLGAQHGLFWRDDDPQSTGERGPTVTHVMTAEQKERGVFDSEVQWVPRALAAVERHVRALPGKLMKTGAISDFYSAYPLESEFMKRRCRSTVDFVQHYDPQQQRIGWDTRGFFCVQQVGDEKRTSHDRVEENSVASFAQLEREVIAESASSYAHAREESPLGEPLPEPQDYDGCLETQARHASWSRCAQEPSILPEPADGDQNELRLAMPSVHLSTDNRVNKNSKHVENRISSARGMVGVAASNRPARCCEFRPEILRMLESLDRVCLLLVQVRSVPKSHPIALLVIVYERRDRERRMRKLIRRAAIHFAKEIVASALALWSRAKLKSPEASSLVCVTPRLVSTEEVLTRELSPTINPSVSMVSFAAEKWTFEMTLSTLVQVNRVLLHAQMTPAPHPLALFLVVFERRKQRRRPERKARKSQALAKSIGGFNIVIPKATLELLSCCLTAALPKMSVL